MCKESRVSRSIVLPLLKTLVITQNRITQGLWLSNHGALILQKLIDADSDSVRGLLIRRQHDIHIAPIDQAARQRDVDLIQPHELRLRPGVKYGNAFSANGRRDIQHRAARPQPVVFRVAPVPWARR